MAMADVEVTTVVALVLASHHPERRRTFFSILSHEKTPKTIFINTQYKCARCLYTIGRYVQCRIAQKRRER